jgi:glyoxylase-like metal-dependent hydrolase (beta-lactamase superfamily II)
VIAVCLIWIFLLPAAIAVERGPAVPDYPADQVTDGVYVIHGPLGEPSVDNQGFMNNPAFIVTGEGVIVVDPGSSVQTGEMVLRQIRKVTRLPVAAVLNTHIHGDHWLANDALSQAFPGVPIYGHPKMVERVGRGEGKEWIDLLLRLTEQATSGTGVVGPNLQVDHEDEIEVAGLKIRFLYLPMAHSDTDLMIEVPAKKLIFLGDNAMVNRFGQMRHGTFKGNIEALDLAIEQQAEHYVPGHGPSGGVEVPETYRRYLKMMREEVAKYLDEGLSDFEMKPQVVEALAEFQGWVDFEGNVGKHISQAYLEVEAELF